MFRLRNQHFVFLHLSKQWRNPGNFLIPLYVCLQYNILQEAMDICKPTAEMK
jgi:hypothetical protein